MAPKNDPLALKRGIQKPRQQQQRKNDRIIDASPASISGASAATSWIAGASGEPTTVPEEVVKAVEKLTRQQLQQLVKKISKRKARILNDVLRERIFRNTFKGYKLKEFHKGQPEQTKKRILERVTEVKNKLLDAGKRDWAEQLKTSSLKDAMSSIRKFAEDIWKNHVESKPELGHLFRKVKYNTNWSCHAESGDNPFTVTPHNQHEAVQSLNCMLKLVLPQNRYN